MAIRTHPGVRSREDRGGDPLDGLVNLFDLGIVLAVAFLLAALSSLDLTDRLLDKGTANQRPEVTVKKNETAKPLKLSPGESVVGRGERVGSVYRLDDGRMVYVAPKEVDSKNNDPSGRN